MKAFAALSLCLIFAASIGAQVPANSASSDEMATILDQQKEILSRLEAIKQLLAVNPALRSAPQPSMPPMKLATPDQSFRGDRAATIAVIEYADFECPYCGQYEHDIYPQIATDYIETGKVKYFPRFAVAHAPARHDRRSRRALRRRTGQILGDAR